MRAFERGRPAKFQYFTCRIRLRDGLFYLCPFSFSRRSRFAPAVRPPCGHQLRVRTPPGPTATDAPQSARPAFVWPRRRAVAAPAASHGRCARRFPARLGRGLRRGFFVPALRAARVISRVPVVAVDGRRHLPRAGRCGGRARHLPRCRSLRAASPPRLLAFRLGDRDETLDVLQAGPGWPGTHLFQRIGKTRIPRFGPPSTCALSAASLLAFANRDPAVPADWCSTHGCTCQ